MNAELTERVSAQSGPDLPLTNHNSKLISLALCVESLVAGYPSRVLLRNLSFCLPAGAFVAILGHNGSGKTTFFRVLTGQLAYQGQVLVLGQEVSTLRRAAAGIIGYLPQRGPVDFAITVRELVLMGRYRHHGLLSSYNAHDYSLADAALQKVGMAHLGPRSFPELSGGEQQLVWLAQLSLQEAQVYLLDEPTQQLDVYYRHQVFKLVHGWAQAGRTVLCSTHDLDNLPHLSGFLLNLSEAVPQLRPLNADTVRAARETLEQAPYSY
jgi:iron complex transport system ATP-binding protein